MKFNQQPRSRFNLAWASLAALLLGLAAPASSQTADSFNPGPNSNVWAIAVQTNGSVLVGGDFTSIGPASHQLFGAVKPGRKPGRQVRRVRRCRGHVHRRPAGWQDSGWRVFQHTAGMACTNLGRLNIDGSFDTNFIAAADNSVQCLAVQADGTILCGGSFMTLRRSTVQRPGPTRDQRHPDTTFTPNPDQPVTTPWRCNPTDKIRWVAFHDLGWQSCLSLGRLNTTNGTLDATFTPSPNAPVTTLAVQADGKILVWRLIHHAGQASPATTLDGSMPTAAWMRTFIPRPNGPPLSVVLQADGTIVVGGSFTRPRQGRPACSSGV